MTLRIHHASDDLSQNLRRETFVAFLCFIVTPQCMTVAIGPEFSLFAKQN